MTGPGRRYAAAGQQAVASPTDTLLTIIGATTIRPGIYSMVFGLTPSVALSDFAMAWYLQRGNAGTGTAVTPTPLDPSSPASLVAFAHNHTIEPGYSSDLILFRMALDGRASHTWWATSGGVLYGPASATLGLGMYPVHASITDLAEAMLRWFE